MKKLFLVPVVMILFALQSFGYTEVNNHYDNAYTRREVATNKCNVYQAGYYHRGYWVERPVVVYRRPYYAPRYYAPRAFVPVYRHGYYHRGC